MSIKEQYAQIVAELEKISQEVPDYFERPAIQEEIALFSRNLRETVAFLDNDCSAEQLVWLSEVFEEIAEKLQSWEFIDALYRAAARFPEECKTYNIYSFLEDAQYALPEEVYRQRHPEGYPKE